MDEGKKHKNKLLEAEIIFCLAYYGTGKTPKEVGDKCEEMKYGLAMIQMLENGELNYDNEKRVYYLTKEQKKAAEELYKLKQHKEEK